MLRVQIIEVLQNVANLPIGGDLAPARERIEGMIAAEREACAKIADERARQCFSEEDAAEAVAMVAVKIRARNQQ